MVPFSATSAIQKLCFLTALASAAIDGYGHKGRRSSLHLYGLFLCTTSPRRATGATRLVVDDVPPAVQLEVATLQQLLLEFLPCALHTRFRARKGQPQALGQLLLRQALIF